jgi:hypothetical protein
MKPFVPALIAATIAVAATGCQRAVAPFSAAHVDRTVGSTAQPLAVEPNRVGSFAGRAKSGAGYFYDEVLEYRVWLHPEHGAPRLAGDEDYFAAFARYETALEYSQKNVGAEEPLVLIRQREWINEPTTGKFLSEEGDRITEWQVKWLDGRRRGPKSISEFLAAHAPSHRATDHDDQDNHDEHVGAQESPKATP